MSCFICAAKFSGFLGSTCNCGEPTPPEPSEDYVVNQGEVVTIGGVPITNAGE